MLLFEHRRIKTDVFPVFQTFCQYIGMIDMIKLKKITPQIITAGLYAR